MLTVEKVLLLSSIGFFSGLPGELLAEASELFEEEAFPAGEAILKMGEYGDSLYIVVSGKVAVQDEGNTMRELGERQVFGELAALDPEYHHYQVDAVDDTMVLKIDHDSLYELIFDHANLAKNVIGYLCKRQRKKPGSAG